MQLREKMHNNGDIGIIRKRKSKNDIIINGVKFQVKKYRKDKGKKLYRYD